jgi:hypothetical protein
MSEIKAGETNKILLFISPVISVLAEVYDLVFFFVEKLIYR